MCSSLLFVLSKLIHYKQPSRQNKPRRFCLMAFRTNCDTRSDRFTYMAKQFAKEFYSSKAWQDCRNEYAKRRHYLCENCLRHGLYRPGQIVHHKIEIDAVTVENPEIALSFSNLELLCRKCHAEAHKSMSYGRRYELGEYGEVIPCDT